MATAIKCGNCKGYHGSTDEVRNCYGVTVRHTATTEAHYAGTFQEQRAATTQEPAATAKQVAYLTKLAHERPMWAQVENMHDDVIARLSKADASAKIAEALTVEREEVETPAAVPNGYEAKRGDVHVVDGIYYRIHVSQRTGKPYAARASIVGAAEWAADGSLVRPADIKWAYDKGMMAKLSEATKATSEQAAAFGKLVGRCCFCSHAIDTPESTAVGYGPVCAAKYGLPWGG